MTADPSCPTSLAAWLSRSWLADGRQDSQLHSRFPERGVSFGVTRDLSSATGKEPLFCLSRSANRKLESRRETQAETRIALSRDLFISVQDRTRSPDPNAAPLYGRPFIVDDFRIASAGFLANRATVSGQRLRGQRSAFSRVCHSEHGYGGYYRSIEATYSSAGWTTDDESKHPLFTRSCRRDGCLITLVSFISTSIPLQFIETSFDLRPCRFLAGKPSFRVSNLSPRAMCLHSVYPELQARCSTYSHISARLFIRVAYPITRSRSSSITRSRSGSIVRIVKSYLRIEHLNGREW